VPKLSVAGTAELDPFALAAFLSDRAGASQGLEAIRRWEALAVIAELGQQRGGQQLTRAR
jgi:hypothetical protein